MGVGVQRVFSIICSRDDTVSHGKRVGGGI